MSSNQLRCTCVSASENQKMNFSVVISIISKKQEGHDGPMVLYRSPEYQAAKV